jgi:hypothetical protein
MDAAGSTAGPPCDGIQVLQLEIDPSNTLILVLGQPLGCPECGRTGDRWTIPTFQGRIVHEEPPPSEPTPPDDPPPHRGNGRLDPGE